MGTDGHQFCTHSCTHFLLALEDLSDALAGDAKLSIDSSPLSWAGKDRGRATQPCFRRPVKAMTTTITSKRKPTRNPLAPNVMPPTNMTKRENRPPTAQRSSSSFKSWKS